MRISDWSSDVCSSDLTITTPEPPPAMGVRHAIELSLRLRQRVRQRGAAGRPAAGAELAAALPLWALCRADLRHPFHGAARGEPPLLALPHPPLGEAPGALQPARAALVEVCARSGGDTPAARS